MFCTECGARLELSARFCVVCGKPVHGKAPLKTHGRSFLMFGALLLFIGVIAAIITTIALSPNQEPSRTSPSASPSPEASITGDWVTDEGIGVTFTADGVFRLTNGDLSLGGDSFRYEIKDESTLYLRPENSFLGAGIDLPYTLNNDSLYIEIHGVTFSLKKK